MVKLLRSLSVFLAIIAMTACSADTIGVEFATFQRPATPNTYLVCPAGRCAAAADEPGPIYAVSAGDLFPLVRTALAVEPRTELVQDQPAALRLVLVQRSRIFRFPDTITVQVFPLSDSSATLAIYSRSNYGRSDLGVNKARVQRWLGLIATQVAQRPSS